MAIVTRRTWTDLKTEHILRVGRGNDATYSASKGRAEQFLTSAYYHVCKTWHHLELDETETGIALTTASNEADVSSIFPGIIFLIELRDAANVFIKTLIKRHARVLLNEYSNSTGEPSYYAQWGRKIYVNTKPDQTYKTRIFYYVSEPEAPNFGVTSSAIGRAWDEILLEYSVYLAHMALGRFDLAGQVLSSIRGQLEEMPQPPLVSDVIVPHPEDRQMDRSHAGASG